MAPREISPAHNADVNEYLATQPSVVRDMVEGVRDQKTRGIRRRPSERLILMGPATQPDWRPKLLDRVAELVDENALGRSDMCSQFAALLRAGLFRMGIRASAMAGEVSYQRADGTWMTWKHAWVEISGDVIVDGNIDTLHENPLVGSGLDPAPYWGPRTSIPLDRRIPRAGKRVPKEEGEGDVDVVAVWLPDLNAWIDQNLAAPPKA